MGADPIRKSNFVRKWEKKIKVVEGSADETGGKKSMRQVKILCDRCGREIEGYPVKVIPELADRDNDELLPENVHHPEWMEKIQDKDFCEACTEKIVRYALGGMKKNSEFEEAVKDMMESAVSGSSKEEKESDTDGEEGKNGRSRIDAGKVMALTKAGWSAAQIAYEMRISTQAVYDARYRLKKEGRL